MKSKIFISYAREDYANAKRLYDSLKSYPDFDPWLDKEKLLPGEDWEHQITEVIDQSHYVILLLSNNSLSKIGFIQKEIRRVLDRLEYFPIDKIFVIPVRIDDCTPRDQKLQKIQWVDLFDDWESGVKRIAKSIRRAQAPVTVSTPENEQEDKVKPVKPIKRENTVEESESPSATQTEKADVMSEISKLANKLSIDLHDNLSHYSVGLLSDSTYMLGGHDGKKKSLSIWLAQAKDEWIEELIGYGLLEYVSERKFLFLKKKTQFTKLGLDLIRELMKDHPIPMGILWNMY